MMSRAGSIVSAVWLCQLLKYVAGIEQLSLHDVETLFAPLEHSLERQLAALVRQPNNKNQQKLPSSIYIPFHLYDKCLPSLDPFYDAVDQYLTCIKMNSIPPRICLSCPEAYANLTVQYYKLKQNQTKVHDSTCSEVVFDNYLMSYATYLYDALHNSVWSNSRCERCVEFRDLTAERAENYTIEYSARASKYLLLMNDWRECVRNASLTQSPHNDTQPACHDCYGTYVALYNFYWNHFAYSDDEFCIDITSTMNDTVYLWREYLQCATPMLAQRQDQTLAVALLGAIFCSVPIIFYIGSYVQGERKLRRLLKYSRLDDANANEQAPARTSASQPAQ